MKCGGFKMVTSECLTEKVDSKQNQKEMGPSPCTYLTEEIPDRTSRQDRGLKKEFVCCAQEMVRAPGYRGSCGQRKV